MSDDLERLIERVLLPLSGASPVGLDLRRVSEERNYTELATRIEADRRYYDSAGFEGEAADWRAVVKLASQILSEESKDLEVATWLTRGLYHTRGLDGLMAGTRLLDQLQTKFWSTLHPDGLAVRKSRVDWLEDKLAADLLSSTGDKNLPTNADALRQMCQSCEKLAKEIKAWPAPLLPSYGASTPALRGVLRGLELLATAAAERLTGMGAPLTFASSTARSTESQPSDIEPEQSAPQTGMSLISLEEAIAAAPVASRTLTAGAARGPRNRDEALRQLDELVRYFSTTEPLGPIGPALGRVARWARGSLRDFLREAIEHEGTLTGLYQLLDMDRDQNKRRAGED